MFQPCPAAWSTPLLPCSGLIWVQTRTSSLGAARPLPPSADIGPAVRWSILLSGLLEFERRANGAVIARKFEADQSASGQLRGRVSAFLQKFCITECPAALRRRGFSLELRPVAVAKGLTPVNIPCESIGAGQPIGYRILRAVQPGYSVVVAALSFPGRAQEYAETSLDRHS